MSTFDPLRRHALTAGVAAIAAAPIAATADIGQGVAAKATTKLNANIRAFQIGAQQGLGSLSLATRPQLQPGPGEVVVEVRASALNHRDLSILAGRYGPPKPAERVPVGDGAGIVRAIGAGVVNFKPGDRVTAPHFILWQDGDYDPVIFSEDVGNTRDGWLAEQIVLPAHSLVRLPESMSFEDAAALGAAGITAWHVIETLGRVKAGDTVLTLGTGGVSVLALQIAKLNGARVAITSSSDEKLAVCRELGADITINYRTQPAWQDAVRAATNGRGVDIVVETVGVSTLTQSLACCAPNARVGLLGALGGPATSPSNLGALILNNIVLKGITSGSKRMLEDLLRAGATNALKPKIDRVFRFDEAADAFAHLQSGEHIGKIVIRHR